MQGVERLSWSIDCVVVGPIQCNCYILTDDVSRKAYVIDPGAESQEILKYLERKGSEIQGVLITHAHIDHIGGIEMIYAKHPVPVFYHPGDRELYENVRMQAELFGVTPAMLQAVQPKVGEASLNHEQEFVLDGGVIRVVHTPGHTPGSVCFLAEGEKPVVFTGDTLFQGSIGRTDLWGGSFEKIIESIQGRLMAMEDSVLVLPGHGPETTIGDERRQNPFLQSGF